jgi:hypothetical protein
MSENGWDWELSTNAQDVIEELAPDDESTTTP